MILGSSRSLPAHHGCGIRRVQELGSGPIGVTIWHVPLFLLPQFGSSPIEALATISVTFWYAWLFNHASGSALLTLIAHAAEGTIESSALWAAEVDTTRMIWIWTLLWCTVALGLLIFNRRFWTRPPITVPSTEQPAGRAESVV
jgi:hypothetical protein